MIFLGDTGICVFYFYYFYHTAHSWSSWDWNLCNLFLLLLPHSPHLIFNNLVLVSDDEIFKTDEKKNKLAESFLPRRYFFLRVILNVHIIPTIIAFCFIKRVNHAIICFLSFLVHSVNYNDHQKQLQSLPTWVNFIQGKMTSIDRYDT